MKTWMTNLRTHAGRRAVALILGLAVILACTLLERFRTDSGDMLIGERSLAASGIDQAGRLVFQGRYLHKNRGESTVWVEAQPDGSIVALSSSAYETTLAAGDAKHRPIRYSQAWGQATANKQHLKFEQNTVVQISNWNDTRPKKEYATEAGALFDPNTRPDPYVMAHILLRRFNLKPGESREFVVCDWGIAGDKQDTFPAYRIRVEHKGKEQITVPAGTFEANHLVQTQLTPSNTWFKKRPGHVTDFWMLDDYTIVRILRHREPYEVVLEAFASANPTSGTATQRKAEATSSTVTLDAAAFHKLLEAMKAPSGAQEAASQAFPSAAVTAQRLYKITGTIRDATPNVTDEDLSRFTSAKDEKGQFAELLKMLDPHPVPNAFVVLRGGAVTLQARADAAGKFEFPRLEGGTYYLSCEHPADFSGEKRLATGETRIDIGASPYQHDRVIFLEIRADRVTLEGRVTDAQGRPVAGAKVSGKVVHRYDPQVGDPPEEDIRFSHGVIPEATAVTAADGTYILQGLAPDNIHHIAGYLTHGRTDALDHVVLQVEAPPLTQGKVEGPRVSLVTEELHSAARRYLAALAQVAKKAGKNLEEKKDIAWPASHGNTITGVDIKLPQPK